MACPGPHGSIRGVGAGRSLTHFMQFQICVVNIQESCIKEGKEWVRTRQRR